jgi:hypothetical protein
MSRDTTVIPFRQPEAIDDPLSEVAREGARRMLAQVLIAECLCRPRGVSGGVPRALQMPPPRTAARCATSGMTCQSKRTGDVCLDARKSSAGREGFRPSCQPSTKGAT